MPFPKMEMTAPATGAPWVLSTQPTSPPPSSANAPAHTTGWTNTEATTAHPNRRQELNPQTSRGINAPLAF